MLYTNLLWTRRLFLPAVMDMAILSGNIWIRKRINFSRLIRSQSGLLILRTPLTITFFLFPFTNVLNVPIWNFTTTFNVLCQLLKFLKLGMGSWISTAIPGMVLEVETWKLV